MENIAEGITIIIKLETFTLFFGIFILSFKINYVKLRSASDDNR